MPATSYAGVKGTGHGTYPPRDTDTEKMQVTDVFVNNKKILVEGDPFKPHQNTKKPYDVHPGSVSAGSGTVFAGNKAVARIGDPIDCGSAVAEGSPDVITGG